MFELDVIRQTSYPQSVVLPPLNVVSLTGSLEYEQHRAQGGNSHCGSDRL